MLKGATPVRITGLRSRRSAKHSNHLMQQMKSLTQTFFNNVNNGTVILKFHFWSGAIIEYTITKNGTIITGTAL